ncbi:MAG: winged helix-turn-helix transcriptional regulator [Bdellovibrionaceae bacterium]|nr:winged helix-turn-helix transcriptional regulator [Pseudobdellovibrionaceae bacterium]
MMFPALFGNAMAEKVLLYIANYGEGYINKIAKTYGVSPSQVQKQLKRLEAGGILVSRLMGNLRVFTLNPRFALKAELLALLERELELLPKEATQKLFRERTRPRRTGKEL